jgi:hypothetical protein
MQLHILHTLCARLCVQFEFFPKDEIVLDFSSTYVFEIACFSAFLIIFFIVDIPSKFHYFSPRKNTLMKQKTFVTLITTTKPRTL